MGNDHWIAEAIEVGTLIAVTDRSYMKDLYSNIHLAALVFGMHKGPWPAMVLLPRGLGNSL